MRKADLVKWLKDLVSREPDSLADFGNKINFTKAPNVGLKWL